MTPSTPQEIIGKSLANKDMKPLLLGAPGYRFRSRWSPAPDTDLTELLGEVHVLPAEQDRRAAKDLILTAAYQIVDTYEGVVPVATLILIEAVRRSGAQAILGLPLEDLAEKLRLSICAHHARLKSDKSGEGAQWPDGLAGDLRRLSGNSQRYGGPAFMPAFPS